MRPLAIAVSGSGCSAVNGIYAQVSATTIPAGFAAVCKAQGWNVAQTWQTLNNGRSWFGHNNGAYIYLNAKDGHWWIDEPGGEGVYIAPAETESSAHAPPAKGWRALRPLYAPLPVVEVQYTAAFNSPTPVRLLCHRTRCGRAVSHTTYMILL